MYIHIYILGFCEITLLFTDIEILLFWYGSNRVASFFLVHDPEKSVPNEQKMYQMVICNRSQIFQKAVKYINIFQSKALKNLPKLRFFV
jgi:hypothetical protein